MAVEPTPRVAYRSLGQQSANRDQLSDWQDQLRRRSDEPGSSEPPIIARPERRLSQRRSIGSPGAVRLFNAGEPAGSEKRSRDFQHFQHANDMSEKIARSAKQAAQTVIREESAAYVPFGAAIALSVGPTVIGWASGDVPANIAAYQTTRAVSLLGVGVGSEILLARLYAGAVRGATNSTLVSAAAVLVTETVWLVHEHGWQKAFHRVEFYEQLGGGVSATSVGIAGGTYATAIAFETGPIAAPLIGASVGIVAGTVAYFGGKSTTRSLLSVLAPQLIHEEERQRIAAAKEMISARIAAAERMEAPVTC